LSTSQKPLFTLASRTSEWNGTKYHNFWCYSGPTLAVVIAIKSLLVKCPFLFIIFFIECLDNSKNFAFPVSWNLGLLLAPKHHHYHNCYVLFFSPSLTVFPLLFNSTMSFCCCCYNICLSFLFIISSYLFNMLRQSEGLNYERWSW
jgi:hypothetical protein